MAEVKEIRDALKRKRRMRTVRRISILIILLALAVIIIINKDNLTHEAISNWLSDSFLGEGEEGTFPVQLSSGNVINVSAVEKSLAVTNQTNIYFYSSKGGLIRSIQHAKKNVQTKVSGDNVLVYSVGGDSVSVEALNKTIAKFKSEKPVTTGEISKSGNFVLATDSDVYTSEMKVYDKNGNAIFRWTPSGGVITSVGIAPDGKHVSAATVYTRGGKIITGIFYFSVSKSEAIFTEQIDDEIVISMLCDKKGVKAITTDSIVTFTKDGERAKDFSYAEKELIGYSCSEDDISIAFKDVNDPEKSVLTVISDEGSISSEASVPYAIKEIAQHGNKVYLLSDEKVLEYQKATGNLSREGEVKDGGEKLCANSSGVYVATKESELIKVNLK